MRKRAPAFFAAFACACLAISGGARAQSTNFTVPPFDQAVDLHGDPDNPDLVIFMAGNQFMVAGELVRAFQRANPGIRRIFFETLPPGVLASQMRSGSLRMGNLVISDRPDVFLSGHRRMLALVQDRLVGRPVAYATNDLAIMVRKSNPKRIESLRDLGRADVRVSMPNPKNEGIAEQIEAAYRKAGGAALVRAIMVTKVQNGTTILTTIHHRQTPDSILNGRADAGPVWISEALYQERIGQPISAVTIPAPQNVTALYEAAVVSNSKHAEAARRFVKFLTSPQARALYRSYGFGSIR